MRFYKLLILLGCLFFVTSCEDEVINPDVNSDPEESLISFELSVFPDIGSTQIPFEISPTDFTDTSKLDLLKFRYDFNNDGAFDTEWVDTAKISHQYTKPGKKTIKIEMKDDKGDYKFSEFVVYVGLLERIAGYNPLSYVNEPSFAKDGTNRIVYNTSADDHQLFIFDLDLGTNSQLTFNDGSEGNNCKHVPDWSPDGKNIAVNYKSNLYIVDANDGSLEKLSELSPFYIEYSPDGKKLLVISSFKYDGTYIVDLDSGEEILFSDKHNGVTWSPDGKQIAEYDKQNNKINILNVEDGSVVKNYETDKLKWLGERDYFLDWSADGKLIYICHYNALLNIETGKFYTIVAGEFKRERLAESAMNKDATMIAFTNSKAEDQYDPIYLFKIPSELTD